MPAALSMHERQQIVVMREQGHSFRKIAEALNRNYETVRKIYQRYKQSGQLAPAYESCRQSAIRHSQAIYAQAIQLKQAHPRWGAGLIWVELAAAFAETTLPSERTLQRWFRRSGVQNAAPDRRPRPFGGRGKRAHEVWAMDAKEQIELGDGTFVSWLTVTDEGSGAVLGASLFPQQTLGDHRPAAGQRDAPRLDELLGATRENTRG